MEQLKEYGEIITSITDNKEYQMIEGILYKFKQEEMAERKDDEKRRLVVPTKFRHNLLQSARNSRFSGHLGTKQGLVVNIIARECIMMLSNGSIYAIVAI
jgi:hypothetical protein